MPIPQPKPSVLSRRVQREMPPLLAQALGPVRATCERDEAAAVFIREPHGPTYHLLQHEDCQVWRYWIPHDDAAVYIIKHGIGWPALIAAYTAQSSVVAEVPLAVHHPYRWQLIQHGADIYTYDAVAAAWRHVPDIPTFQARGYRWCDVATADADLLDRVPVGAPLPAMAGPERSDYPSCHQD